MGLGYLLSCPGGSIAAPPFVQPEEGRQVTLWTMSQRTGSVSYQTFAAGFSLAVYALFVVLCDIGSLRVGLFRTFGQNALAAYIVHPMVAGAVKPYIPRDSPLVVRRGRIPALFRNLLLVHSLSGEERDLPAALTQMGTVRTADPT